MQDTQGKKDEKLTTKFEPSNDEDVIYQAYLDEKLSKIEGHFSYIEKDYIEFKLRNDYQSVEEVSFEKAVKTTIQILYDKGIFDNCDFTDEVLRDYLFVETCKPDLEEANDVIQ